jgi:hypothetical protein
MDPLQYRASFFPRRLQSGRTLAGRFGVQTCWTSVGSCADWVSPLCALFIRQRIRFVQARQRIMGMLPDFHVFPSKPPGHHWAKLLSAANLLGIVGSLSRPSNSRCPALNFVKRRLDYLDEKVMDLLLEYLAEAPDDDPAGTREAPADRRSVPRVGGVCHHETNQGLEQSC